MTVGVPASPPRSTFVTVLAWLFITAAGFTTLISVLQNVVLTAMPQDTFKAALEDSNFTRVMPGSVQFMFGHLRLLALSLLALSVVTLGASIGLLLRYNWARILFVGLLVFDIGYSISALVMQKSMAASVARALPPDSLFAHDSTLSMTFHDVTETIRVMNTVAYVVSLGFVLLFGWIIARLVSRRIRDEFRPRAPDA